MYHDITYSCTLLLLCCFEGCSSKVPEEPITEDIMNENENEPDPILRIGLGVRAKLGDVPYQVGFKRLASHEWLIFDTFCGGSIIGPAKIVSAAHCFEKKDKSSCFSDTITLGKKVVGNDFAVAGTLLTKLEYDPNYSTIDTSRSQWRRLKYVVYPSSYDFPKDDVAVVIIESPFRFNAYVAPINIATKVQTYPGSCLASGYGLLKSKKGSQYLMMAPLDIIARKDHCDKLTDRNSKDLICTSRKKTSIEKGDSGGPLVCIITDEKNETVKPILVGVTCGHIYGEGTEVKELRRESLLNNTRI